MRKLFKKLVYKSNFSISKISSGIYRTQVTKTCVIFFSMLMGLLLEAQRYGITKVDLSNLKMLEAQIEMKKAYLDSHGFSITQTKDGRWRTFLPNHEGKKGREIRRKNYDDLVRFLLEFYEDNGGVDDRLSFKSCYDEWVLYYHRKNNNSENTRYKYLTDYNRFLKDTSFERRDIRTITDIIIDDYLIDTIYSNGHITYKTFTRVYGYLAGTFNRARRRKIIQDNPMDYICKRDYYKTCQRPKVKTAETELITDEDFDSLLKQLYSDMVIHPEYLPTYAVELGALTGMRVAELAALKWEDIDWDQGVIIISRSDRFNRITKTWTVVDSTKTNKIRSFPIDTDIERSLKRLHYIQVQTDQVSEWLFPHKEYGWTHSNIISSCLKNKCKQIGLNRCYGIHAFRKTLNSGMRTDGASALLCSGIMGNSLEVNNKYYSYDTSNMEEKRARVASEHAKRDFH